MKVKSSIIFALTLTSSMSLFAAKTSVTGILTDDMCTKKHMMPGKPNADCVRECIKHGAKYVVVSQGKVYELQGDQNTFSELAGKKVTITGEVKGSVLSVSSAQVAQ